MTTHLAGGSISSDGGLVLLRGADRRLGLAETLAGCIREWRVPEPVVHSLSAMLRLGVFAIACGYEDADDCEDLRSDLLFMLAVGRAPQSGRDLCSSPTMNRLENAPSRIEVARMTFSWVDIYCRSFPTSPAAITLDDMDVRAATRADSSALFIQVPLQRLIVAAYHGTDNCPAAHSTRRRSPGGNGADQGGV